MRILGVLDIRRGVVVRGIGGRRSEYRSVVSTLTASAHPLDVARAFRTHFGISECYIADLDALEGHAPDLRSISTLAADGFRLWVDAGVRTARDVEPLATLDIAGVVVGLETWSVPTALGAAVALLRDRAVFSLDLRAGRPLSGADWGSSNPWDVACRAIDMGVRRLLVLDLVRVGANGGTGTEDLCGRLAAAYPTVEISAGGGVRGAADLVRLRHQGVAAVLVASALHDGRLSRGDVEDFHNV